MTTNDKIIHVSRYLVIIWVALSLSEAIVTYFCLNNPGMFEANPFARSLWARSEVLFYGIKLLITVAVGLGFWLMATRTRHVKPMIACQVFLVLMFSGVLFNNLLKL